MQNRTSYLRISLWLFLILGFCRITVAQHIHKDTTIYKNHGFDAGYNAITTTPFTIPKGSLVYQNLMLGINTLEYGITDKLSVATGISFFGMNRNRSPLALLFLKYNLYDANNFAVSISSLNSMQRFNYSWFPEEFDETRFEFNHALFLNAASYKDKYNFVSFGVGAFVLSGESSVIFTLGFSKRATESLAVIGDLWLPRVDFDSPTLLPIPAIGVRYFTKSGASFDFGFPFVGAKVPLIKPKRKQALSF